MARSNVRKAIKHMLHEDGATAADASGQLHSAKIYKRIVPKKDLCINRENPNRKLPRSRALVAGFDPRGTFGGVIPHGFTHGYWTMNRSPDQQPAEDGAGNTYSGDYVSRILLEFDLDDAGLTAGDKVEDATLSLYFYRSKSIQGGSEFTFDFHRFHPGLTANRGGSASASASITCDIIPGTDVYGDTLTITDATGRALVFTAGAPNDNSTRTFKTGATSQKNVLINLYNRIVATTHGFTGTNGITGAGANGDTDYLVDHGSDVWELRLVNYGPASVGPSGNVSIVTSDPKLLTGATGTITGFSGGSLGGNSETFTENATWWEHDFSGGATYDSTKTWTALASGATGNFSATGVSQGTRRWEEQGLGISGSTAEHTVSDVTLYKDFSGGPAGSDQDQFADNIYSLGFTANSTTVKANKRLELDVQTAVVDALENYDNKLRIMIKLRDDDMMDGTSDRAYVTFYSSEAEGTLSAVDFRATNDAKFSPSLQVTYLR